MCACETRCRSRLTKLYVPPVTEAAIFEEETPTGVDKAIEVNTVSRRTCRIAGELDRVEVCPATGGIVDPRGPETTRGPPATAGHARATRHLIKSGPSRRPP